MHVQRHTYRVNTPNRDGTGTWMHVKRNTHTCIRRTHLKRPVQARACKTRECTHQKGTVQARGCKSRDVHTHKQGVHTKDGRYWHVNERSKEYTHVHKAAKGTWMHVQMHAYTYTGRKHRNRPAQARGCTSRGIHTRAQGVHTEKGL